MNRSFTIILNIFLCSILASCSKTNSHSGSALKGDFQQQVFATPEELVATLKSAVNNNDSDSLLKVVGPKGRNLIFSGDPISDRLEMKFFAQRLNERAELVPYNSAEFSNLSVMKLRIGKMGLNAGIPLINEGKGWRLASGYFAPRSVKRRIASNEIQVWRACAEYVEAQKQYIQKDRDGDSILEYAQRLLSSPGHKDGLYWKTNAGEVQSPLGEVIASAIAKGYSKTNDPQTTLYHGYVFRILTAQGKSARSGERQYIVNGNLIHGFALVAYPIEWGTSGLRTFIVGPEGLIYGKNLGVSTESLATKLEAYNPDKSWFWVQQPQIDEFEQYLDNL